MPEGSFYSSLMRTIFSLLVVFGLLFALRYYVLRQNSSRQSRPGLISIRDRVSLGPRSQVVIITVASKEFLVCMSDNAVQILPLEGLPDMPLGSSEQPMFASQLHDIMTLLKQGGKK